MYLFDFILITLLAITSFISVQAKISIEIKTGVNSSDIFVDYSGIDTNIVTDDAINQFGLDYKSLKEAVKKHYNGTRPKGVFLKSPTPWGDLYKIYHWEQVTKVLSVKGARVKGVQKRPRMILTQDFDNVFNNTIKVNAGISHTVDNTAVTSWSRNNEITVSQEVEYDVNILIGKLSGTTGFSYTSSWGQTEEKSETVTIGATSAVEIELKPGQSATAELIANKAIIKVEIYYEAKLRGNVAVNFKKQYKNHHFWGPTIENVMMSGKIKNRKTTTQFLKLDFYTDASLKVYDKESKKIIV